MELYLENGTGLFMEVGDRAAERQNEERLYSDWKEWRKDREGKSCRTGGTARVCGKSWKIMII